MNTRGKHVCLCAGRLSQWKSWAVWIGGHPDGSKNWQYELTLLVETNNAGGRTGGTSRSLCALHWLQRSFVTSALDAELREDENMLPGAVWMGCVWAITPTIWQLRKPSAETRPSLKCELDHFSKPYVARNDREASDSFWVNVKAPEGLI